MAVSEKLLRAEIIAKAQAMLAQGLTSGSSGNISARIGEAMLITPSAVPYPSLRPPMIARMPLNGEYGAWKGPLQPSSEWRFHLDIMRARSDVGAIVHCHSPYATAMSMTQKPILAAHYMIALFGGPVIRCTKYAPYGTKELSELVVEALGDRHGVLLGNHGALTTGPTLESAMFRAQELENLARLYAIALSIGRPVVLTDEGIARIVERFKTYGAGIAAGMGESREKSQEKKEADAKRKAPADKRAAKKKAPGKKKGLKLAGAAS